MRFLLFLVAMLSGLSLADVAVAMAPAEVVGVAVQARAETAPATIACPVRDRIARATVRINMSRPLAPRDAGFARSCGVTIADCPHE
jgi:hypothetical protein